MVDGLAIEYDQVSIRLVDIIRSYSTWAQETSDGMSVIEMSWEITL
jgi:hypothetical protein